MSEAEARELDAEKVLAFIQKHPDLSKPLLEAPDEIKKIFGDAAPVSLRFSYPGERDSIYIIVKTTLEPEEAVEKEEKLRYDWYFELPRSIRERLHVREEPLTR